MLNLCPQQRLRWRTKAAINVLIVVALSLYPGRSQGFVSFSKAVAGLDGMIPLLTQNRHTGLRQRRLRPCKFIVLAPLVTALLSSVSSSPSSGKAKAKAKLIVAAPDHLLSEAVGPFPDYASFERALGNLIGDHLQDSGGRIVISRGSPLAKLCIVGEAPGAREDEIGEPFVGRSGNLLDAILQSVGFNVEKDVYITNLIRRRPPGNRDPLSMEVSFYEKWLREEIRLVDPDIIITTGRFSMRAILNEKRGITKVRGQWYEVEYGGRKRHVMPIFHPSYLLRNPTTAKNGPRYLTWTDMKNAREKYMDHGCGVEVKDYAER